LCILCIYLLGLVCSWRWVDYIHFYFFRFLLWDLWWFEFVTHITNVMRAAIHDLPRITAYSWWWSIWNILTPSVFLNLCLRLSLLGLCLSYLWWRLSLHPIDLTRLTFYLFGMIGNFLSSRCPLSFYESNLVKISWVLLLKLLMHLLNLLKIVFGLQAKIFLHVNPCAHWPSSLLSFTFYIHMV